MLVLLVALAIPVALVLRRLEERRRARLPQAKPELPPLERALRLLDLGTLGIHPDVLATVRLGRGGAERRQVGPAVTEADPESTRLGTDDGCDVALPERGCERQVLLAAEVVDLEHEVLGERLGVAPQRPADARVDEPVLMARGVDRLHPPQPEVPFEVGLDEGRDKPAGGGIDVQRDVDATLALEGVECRGDLLDRLVAAVERAAQHRDDADRVLVAQLHRLLAVEVPAIAVHRHQARLDVPVAAELLPADLDVDPGHEVRRVDRLPRRPPVSAPAPQQRHPTEHRRLARACGRSARGPPA